MACSGKGAASAPEPYEKTDLRRLPAEIRLKIYTFVLSGYIACPNELSEARVRVNERPFNSRDWSEPVPGLLLTCKEVRNEALPVYLDEAIFELPANIPDKDSNAGGYVKTLCNASQVMILVYRKFLLMSTCLSNWGIDLRIGSLQHLRCKTLYLVDGTPPEAEDPDEVRSHFLQHTAKTPGASRYKHP